MNCVSDTVSTKSSSYSVWMLAFCHWYIIWPHDLLKDRYSVFSDKFHSHNHIRRYKLNYILSNELHPSIGKELLCLLSTELKHPQIGDSKATLLNNLNYLSYVNILLRFYHCKRFLKVILLIKCFLREFISVFS